MGLKQFTVYENASVSSLTDLGSIAEQMTEVGHLEFVPSNFKREYKMVADENGVMVERYNRLLVLIFNGQIDPISKKPVSVSYPCSEDLSRELRLKPELLLEIGDNHIFEGTSGIPFIGRKGEGNIVIEAKEMKTTTVKATRTGLERLIAL
jgi:hypothetical protein